MSARLPPVGTSGPLVRLLRAGKRAACRYGLLALAAGILVGCGTPATPEAGGDSAQPGEGTEIAIGSADLVKEYKADRASADAKYKGNWVVVEGPLGDVMESLNAVTLEGVDVDAADPKSAHAMACDVRPKSMAQLLDLTRGQVVKIRGRCVGDQGMAFIGLADCEVLEVGPDPAVVVSAADLTRAFAADREAATARYEKKHLLVEGLVVESWGPRQDSGYQVKAPGVLLAGFDEKAANPLRVHVTFPTALKKEIAGLKKGDRVKVKGECSGIDLGSLHVDFWGMDQVPVVGTVFAIDLDSPRVGLRGYRKVP